MSTIGLGPRLRREKRTLDAMLRIYCEGIHGSSDALCAECRALSEYAHQRLDYCVHGESKPTCANCSVHCYRAAKRERIRKVMRYAGPRMLGKHPVIAIRHMLDGRRKPPPVKTRGKP